LGKSNVTENDVEKLLENAKDKDEKKRTYAVNEFAKIASILPKSIQTAVIDELLVLTDDDDKNVKMGAITALGQFGENLPESLRDKVVKRLLEGFHLFDIKDEDVFWCTADIGWVTGHSYIVYGPLATGTTGLMFEGAPTYPYPDRCWQIVEKFKVNVFYTAPTLIRALMNSSI